MIKTPDRFPGSGFQEELILEENAVITLPESGSLRFISGSLSFMDTYGIFNPRGGRDSFYFRDDFVGDSLLPNWNSVVSGNGSLVSMTTNELGGAISLISGNAAGRFAQLNFGGFQILSVSKNISFFCRFQYKNTANSFSEISIRAGINNRIRFHKSGNANIFFSTHSGGTETSIDTGISPDTDYHLVEIKSVNNGSSVSFYYDNILKATSTTNIPTTNMEIFLYQETLSSNIRTLNIDLIDIRQNW